ncbi:MULTISPECIES: TetR family transcriptional regulator [unclassified Nonomuraea]|uniref:TetR/AcrR family transcriptional regulator n=1 Tax=unclassified Nonomuraea TaxID=2593643 RepID=UPI0033FDA7D7
MTSTQRHELTRDERRVRSRQAILDAARELFAEHGYEQTTIRAVAAQAGIDPGLVMQHFGTKEALFDEVAHLRIGIAAALPGPPERLGERVLRHVLDDIEHRPDTSLPVLRSMLTHPQAAETVRCAVADPDENPLADVLTGQDARLRAALAGTLVLGLLVGRYLLRIPEINRAPVTHLVRLLGPCLQPLLTDAPLGVLPIAASHAATRSAANGRPERERTAGPERSADHLARLAEAEHARVAAVEEVDRCARDALAAGASYGEVGRMLGISRQAARQRWATSSSTI